MKCVKKSEQAIKEMMKLSTKGAAKWGTSPSPRDASQAQVESRICHQSIEVGWMGSISFSLRGEGCIANGTHLMVSRSRNGDLIVLAFFWGVLQGKLNFSVISV